MLGIASAPIASAQVDAPPVAVSGQPLDDGSYTFDEDPPGTGSYTAVAATRTHNGTEWRTLTVTFPDGSIRVYLWDAEAGVYSWGALPVKTIKITTCPGCGGKLFERSDGDDGTVTPINAD